MSRTDVLIAERSVHWMVITDEASQSFDHNLADDALATSVFAWLQSNGVNSAAAVLAPASTSCFFASLNPSKDIDVRDRASLAFELEDHLPIDAESFVADYVVCDDKNVAAIAIEYRRWKSIADSFESVGLPIRSIVPESILVARAMLESGDATGDVRLMLVNGDQVDAIGIVNQRVCSWKHLPLDSQSLIRHKKLEGFSAASLIAVSDQIQSVQTIADVFGNVETYTEPTPTYCFQGASLYLADRSGPWFELRRDKLAPTDRFRSVRKNLRFLALAASLFLLALALGGWYRSKRIDDEVSSIRARQETLFKQAYPGTKAPGAIVRRVRSEHARMMGARGATLIDVPIAAPVVLRSLLSSLPLEVRFQIQALAINNGEVSLDLAVRSPVDAGAIATALSAGGFSVDPPVTTQKDAQTFSSTIKAKWAGRGESVAKTGSST